jgi:ketosteroid isomerase-like protein
VEQAVTSWTGAWEDFRFEPRRLIECGESKVLVEGWQGGRGKSSGVEVSEEIFSVYTIKGGKIVRQRMFRDRDEAAAAAGLSE